MGWRGGFETSGETFGLTEGLSEGEQAGVVEVVKEIWVGRVFSEGGDGLARDDRVCD